MGNLQQKEVKPKNESRKRNPFRSAVAGAMLAVATIFPGHAKADPPKEKVKPAEKNYLKLDSVTLRGGYGAYYRKGNGISQFALLGVSTALKGELSSVPFMLNLDIDGTLKGFETQDAQLDRLSLSITVPINQWFALTPFVYRELYCGDVPIGGGIAFHIPKLGLHAAPHLFKLNDEVAMPLPIFWTGTIGRLGFRAKVIIITNHNALAHPAPLAGFEGGITLRAGKNIALFGQAFTMTVHDNAGKIFIGPASVQIGTEYTF